MKTQTNYLFDYNIFYKSYSKKGHAYNSIQLAKKNRWLPISVKSIRFSIILDIFSWVYGDGHLHDDGFLILSGQRNDLEKIAQKVKNYLNLEFKIVWDPYKGKKKTNTHEDTCRLYLLKGCRPFGRLLMALGAPVGAKVYNDISIPEWIMKGNIKIKKRFLEVFFSNEITVRKIEKKGYVPKFEIRMNKSRDKVDNGLYFLNQVKQLLKDCGIESRNPKVTNRQGKNKTLSIVVAGDLINVYKFYKTFNLRYAQGKNTSLEIIGKEVERKLTNHFQDIMNYKQAMLLRQRGLGRRKVSKLMNLNIHLVDGWFRRNCKPIFLEKEEALETLLRSSLYGIA